MIVLDANFLIRAVLGRRVRQLLETYSDRGLRFCAPDVGYADALKYLPPLLQARRISDTGVPATLEYLQSLVEPVSHDVYVHFQEQAEQSLRGRDEEDWPVLAAALAMSCPI
jgi:predicted nucleic acid-binding protein